MTRVEIQQALATRDITGKHAELLTDKFAASFTKIEARGGIDVISNNIAARIEAARKRLQEKGIAE